MKRVYSILMLVCALSVTDQQTFSQDTTAPPPLVKGGIYDRPYIFRPSSRIAIGGYAETMVRSEYEQGIHENVSFEARRFNIFIFSSISPNIKLTSELEFEHGTEEIALQSLKLGAIDYIIKSQGYLHHLPYSVENAFFRIKARRERNALIQREKKFHTLANQDELEDPTALGRASRQP